MFNGRLLCIGSPGELRERYCPDNILQLRSATELEVPRCKEFAFGWADGVEFVEQIGTLLRFRVPNRPTSAGVASCLPSHDERPSFILDWDLRPSTLEDVFLSVIRKADSHDASESEIRIAIDSKEIMEG